MQPSDKKLQINNSKRNILKKDPQVFSPVIIQFIPVTTYLSTQLKLTQTKQHFTRTQERENDYEVK